jgi:hypothetical protein
MTISYFYFVKLINLYIYRYRTGIFLLAGYPAGYLAFLVSGIRPDI